MFKRENIQMVIAVLFWFVSYIPFLMITNFHYGTVLSIITSVGVYAFIGNWIDALKKTESNGNC